MRRTVRRASALLACAVTGALLAGGGSPAAPADPPAVAAPGAPVLAPRADVPARVDRLAPQVARWWRLGALPVTVQTVGTAAELPATERPAGGSGWVAVTTGTRDHQRLLVAADAWSRLTDPARDLVVAHELTHAAARAAARGPVPTWLEEGVAEWLARRLVGADLVPAAATPATRPGPPQAADFGGDTAGWAYATSAAMVDVLAEHVRPAGLVDLYVAVAAAGPAGSDVDAVLLARAGVDVAALTTHATTAARA